MSITTERSQPSSPVQAATPRSAYSPSSPSEDQMAKMLAQERLKSASLHDQILQMQAILNNNSLQARDETVDKGTNNREF